MEWNYEDYTKKYVNAAELMEYAEKHPVGVDTNDLLCFINGHSVSSACLDAIKELAKPVKPEQIYIFIFQDGSHYIMNCGICLKHAVQEMSKYMGFGSELMCKALKGFDNTDIDGIIQLSNQFASGVQESISQVYTVGNVLYDDFIKISAEYGYEVSFDGMEIEI